MPNKKLTLSDGSWYPKIPDLCHCSNHCGEIVYNGHKFVQGHHLYGDSNPMKNPDVSKKVSDAQLGKNNHRYGKHYTEKEKEKLSKIAKRSENKTRYKKGNPSPWKDKHLSESHKTKISKILEGKYLQENSPHWKGGSKLSVAKSNHRRRSMGFIPLTIKNPYNESTEYHHIDPNRPYVVPCPTRIHKIFNGHNREVHAQYVNMFLGIKRLEDIDDTKIINKFNKYKLKKYNKRNESLFDF